MKKIPSVFKRDYGGSRLIYNEVVEGCEWVLEGEGVATEKYDGAACAVIDGMFMKRYDAKNGKIPLSGFIPCQEPDPVTGHYPGWVPVRADRSEDTWFIQALINASCIYQDDNTVLHVEPYGGTYEAIGPHFQRNPYNLAGDTLIRHGAVVIEDAPRTFEGLRSFFEQNPGIEGIVFHRENGDMAKIKRIDYGLPWNGKAKKDSLN